MVKNLKQSKKIKIRKYGYTKANGKFVNVPQHFRTYHFRINKPAVDIVKADLKQDLIMDNKGRIFKPFETGNSIYVRKLKIDEQEQNKEKFEREKGLYKQLEQEIEKANNILALNKIRIKINKLIEHGTLTKKTGSIGGLEVSLKIRKSELDEAYKEEQKKKEIKRKHWEKTLLKIDKTKSFEDIEKIMPELKKAVKKGYVTWQEIHDELRGFHKKKVEKVIKQIQATKNQKQLDKIEKWLKRLWDKKLISSADSRDFYEEIRTKFYEFRKQKQ